MFAPGGANSPPARQSRAIRMHSEGPRGPSEPPDGCCVRMARRRSPSSASSRVSCAIKGARNACKKCCGIRLWGTGGKRQPCGLLPPKAAKRPAGAPKGSACPVARREACARWALARSAKRPEAHRREASARWAVAAKGGKATRRCEQIQGLRAASAQNADICEGSETMSATVREARMIEQPGHLPPKAAKRPEGAPKGSACPVGCCA